MIKELLIELGWIQILVVKDKKQNSIIYQQEINKGLKTIGQAETFKLNKIYNLYVLFSKLLKN